MSHNDVWAWVETEPVRYTRETRIEGRTLVCGHRYGDGAFQEDFRIKWEDEKAMTRTGPILFIALLMVLGVAVFQALRPALVWMGWL